MDKRKLQRSKSAARAQSPSRELSLDQILKLINPLHKQTIELEDMKRILQKIPEKTRSKVQKIFHTYIFSSKSFSLQIPEFCKMFDSMKIPEDYDKNHFISVKHEEPRNSELSKMHSVYSEAEKNIKRREKSISPERQPKQSTYAKIYEEKKKEKDHRKMNRRNTQPFEISPSVDTSPSYKNTGEAGIMAPRSFKDCYPNLQELLEIRKAHLQQTYSSK